MKQTKKLLAIILVLAMILPAAVFAVPAGAAEGEPNWVAAWHGSILNVCEGSQAEEAINSIESLSPSKKGTFRIQLATSLGGKEFRLRLSNKFGTGDITVGGVSVALQGKYALSSQDNSTRVDAKNAYGRESFKIPQGGSETVFFTMKNEIPAGSSLIINIYCESTTSVRDFALTGGTAWFQSSFILSKDFRKDETLSAIGNRANLVSTNEGEGDYNLLPLVEELDVKASSDAYSVVFIGDSTITNSIPDMVEENLRRAGIYNVSVVSSAIKGNELLQNGAGKLQGPLEGDALITRIDNDAFAVAGVKKVFVKIGANDILHPMLSDLADWYNHSSTRPDGYTPTAEDIIGGLEKLIGKANAAGVEIYFSDINPMLGYTRGGGLNWTLDMAQNANGIREAVNAWLAGNTDKYAGYAPFSAAVGADYTIGGATFADGQIDDRYATDKVHPSPLGMQTEADLVPISWFGSTEDTAENRASVKNIWVASNSLPKNGKWMISSGSGNGIKNTAGQRGSVYLLAVNGGSISQNVAAIRRGTTAAPYIVMTDALSGAVFVRYGYGTRIYWRNSESGKFVAFDYNIGNEQTVGLTDSQPQHSVLSGGADGFYTFNTTSAVWSADPWELSMHFGAASGISDDKYLVYENGKFRAYKGTGGSRGGNGNGTVTYLSAVDSVNTVAEAILGAAATFTNGAAGTVVPVGFRFTDDLKNNSATLSNSTPANTNSFTFDGNADIASLLFTGYAYGGGMTVSCVSDNTGVAAYDPEARCVKLGGAFGTAYLTWTFSWVEADGAEYSMTVRTTVTNGGGKFTIVHTDGTKNEYDATPNFNIAACVADGMLYGGTFADADHSKVAELDGDPTCFMPQADATYYLREVSANYLAPKSITLWDGTKTIVAVRLLSTVDSLKYRSVGFVIDGEEFEVAGNTVWETVNVTQSGKVKQRLYAGADGKLAVETGNGDITDRTGYVSMLTLPDALFEKMKSDSITYTPYWITLDGVRVTGATERNCKRPQTGTLLDIKDDPTGSSVTPATQHAEPAKLLSARAVFDGEEPENKITVTVHDGETVAEHSFKSGSISGKLEYIGAEGMVFAGWYADEALTVPADLSDVQSDITVYAKYVSNAYLTVKYTEQRQRLFRVTGVSFAAAIEGDGTDFAETGFIVNGERIAVEKYTNRFAYMNARLLFGSKVARNAPIMSGEYSFAGCNNGDELMLTPYWVTHDGTFVEGATRTLVYRTYIIEG